MEALKRKIVLPDTLLIVGSVLILFISLTWILPAGEFDTALKNGQQIIIPGSYKTIASSPQGIGALFTAPVKGFMSASQIIAFVFILGGAFSILARTGAIEAGLQNIIKLSFQKNHYKKAIIPVLMIFFSLAGATFGMCEEVLLFILITIPFSLAVGYDTLVGVAIPFVGAGAGFAGAITNPFTIGIAQGIAELPLFSGWEYRIIVWIVLTTAAILYVMHYANQLDKKKVVSSVQDIDKTSKSFSTTETLELTSRRKTVLLLFLLTIIMLIVGVNTWDWYINEITGLFLALSIVATLVYRINSTEAVAAFSAGAKDMIPAALVIAMAKAVLVVATDGKIIDTVLFHLSNAVNDYHPLVSAEILFVIQNVLHVFIPSGSGQAALTMPVMAPLSDILNISRQTSVLIFQLGDGIGSMVIPTSGVTMGVLTAAKIPYEKWIKWIWPLMIILFILSALLLIPPMVLFHYE